MKEMVSVGLVVLSSFDHPTHLVDLDSLFFCVFKIWGNREHGCDCLEYQVLYQFSLFRFCSETTNKINHRKFCEKID